MLSATKAYICSAFMKWADISSTSESISSLSHLQQKGTSVKQQWDFLEEYLGKFVDEFAMTEFDIEKKWREEKEKKKQEMENQTTPANPITANVGTSTTGNDNVQEAFAPGT